MAGSISFLPLERLIRGRSRPLLEIEEPLPFDMLEERTEWAAKEHRWMIACMFNGPPAPPPRIN